jgi:hypothetical protein
MAAWGQPTTRRHRHCCALERVILPSVFVSAMLGGIAGGEVFCGSEAAI